MTPARARWQPWLSALCGAGCGLVLWVALSSTLLLGGAGTQRKLVDLQTWGLALGALLAAAGLGALLPRPPAPGRWWPRSLAALLLTLACAVALVVLQRRPDPDPAWLALLALLACLGALAAVVGLALVENDRPGLQLPARLALALLGGASLLFALIALRWPGPILAAGPVPSLVLLVAMASALVVAGWWTQGRVAQRRGRWLALGLLAGLPLLVALLLHLQPGWARTLWPLVALSVLGGSVLERLPAR